MRIGLVSTLAARVESEPGSSGSVEGLVWLLSRELSRLGHDVTVFAAGGSSPAGRLVAALPGPYATDGSPDDWQVCEWINLCRAVEDSRDFDVLHSHSYLHGLPLEPLARCAMVHTLHVWPYEDLLLQRARYPRAAVTGLTAAQWTASAIPPSAVVPSAVDPQAFTFRPETGRYLCWLGRFIPGKGPVDAIHIARRTGIPLVLAGPPNDYFHQAVAPLVDGRHVSYVGAVGSAERDGLLGGALALVLPLRAAEPFGLVMAEAMLCGTPVATVVTGAAREMVDHGLTGRLAVEPERLADEISLIGALDRHAVRRRALQRFAPEAMATGYLAVYEQTVSRRWGGRVPDEPATPARAQGPPIAATGGRRLLHAASG